MEDFGMNSSSGMALSGQVDPMRSLWDKIGALDGSTDLTAIGKGAYTSGAEKLSMLDTKAELNPSQSLNVVGTDSQDISKFVATSNPSSDTTEKSDPLTGIAETTPLVAPATPTVDFNGDGNTDLLWRSNSNGENVVWLMEGTKRISTVALPTVADRDWRIEATADFDNDGDTDLAWRKFDTGSNSIWLMNGTRLDSSVKLPTVKDLSWQIEGSGDFNSDGKADLLWRDYDTGNNSVWLMNGTRLDSSVALPPLPNTKWQLEAAGDFNGDDQTDLVWRHTSTNRSAIWLMNGTRLDSSVALLPTVPSSSWQIRAVGDFNGDDQADIGWRNVTTDQGAIWLMDGTRLASSASIPAFPGPWEIVGPR